eukprot:scaffold2261_cov405-Prasinococcus_capsulatus_cf.AAC.26
MQGSGKGLMRELRDPLLEALTARDQYDEEDDEDNAKLLEERRVASLMQDVIVACGTRASPGRERVQGRHILSSGHAFRASVPAPRLCHSERNGARPWILPIAPAECCSSPAVDVVLCHGLAGPRPPPAGRSTLTLLGALPLPGGRSPRRPALSRVRRTLSKTLIGTWPRPAHDRILREARAAAAKKGANFGLRAGPLARGSRPRRRRRRRRASHQRQTELVRPLLWALAPRLSFALGRRWSAAAAASVTADALLGERGGTSGAGRRQVPAVARALARPLPSTMRRVGRGAWKRSRRP